MDDALSACSQLPGFGFHPSDNELVTYYLKRKILGLKFDYDVIPQVEIYKHEPWDLPEMCHVPSKHSKWHFFTLPDRKYGSSSRSNRATQAGYWKSTGRDRSIKSQNHIVGTKKTLVFYEGRPPSGKRTEWIMHEYYIDENEIKAAAHVKDIYVLCRITKRDGLETTGEKAPMVSEANTVPQQPEDTIHSAVSNEAPTSPDNPGDIDAWIEELLKPDVGLHHASDLEHETWVESSLPAPEPEKVGSLVDRSAVDDSEFLLQEDLYNILFPEAVNFNTDAFGCQSAELQAGLLLPNYGSGVFCDDLYDNMHSVVKADSTQDLPTASEATASIRPTEPANSGNQIESSDTGIQIRPRLNATPTQATNRIRLEVSKMESSNRTSVNRTFELFAEKHHLNGQQTVDNSKLALEKSPEASYLLHCKKKSHSTSDLQFPVASKTKLSIRSAALNWLICGACIAGILALLVYFLQSEAWTSFASFSSLNL